MLSAAARGTLGASNRAVDRPPGLGRARPPAGDRLGRSSVMRVLLAGATGVIGGEAVPVLAAAASTRSRAQLDWKPAYGSWRSGLTADLGLRAPGESQNQAAGSQ